MPNANLVAGGDAWGLGLMLIATGATLTLSALLVVFTRALYRYHERETPVALHFTLANVFASVYVIGDLIVHLDLAALPAPGVMVAYRLCLSAIVMVLAALIVLERVLARRRISARRLAAVYLVGLAISTLLWIEHPALLIASNRYAATPFGVFADYGAAAAPFFAGCVALFAMVVFRILRRARRTNSTLVWQLTLFGFSVFILAGVHDAFREFGLKLLPFSALIPGCLCFQVGAFAAMTIHYSQTLRDRLQHDHQLRRLQDKATRDPLSGLFNRAYLQQHLEQSDANGGLLFIDLDHFKTVNDRFGHEHGDHMIRAVSDCIRGTLRDGDIACRWGGDEFVVYLADADAGAGPLIEERLLRAFADIRLPEAAELAVSASMGFAQLTDGDWRITLQRADQALYQAKAGGRRRLAVAP